MKKFLAILILIFTLPTPSQADDLRDFQIEGLSIGDSALDYFSEDEMERKKKYYPKSKKWVLFVKKISSSKIYDAIQVHFKDGDNKYIIGTLDGHIYYKNNIEDCYKKMDEIEIEISKIFKNTREYKWYAPWRGKFNENDFEEDIRNLEIFYKNQGYRDFKVLSKDIVYLKYKIEINLDIYEGEKYFYKEFYFINNEKFSDEELLNKLDITPGDQYNKEKLDFAIFENINSLYMDQGYYFFNINKEIIPYRKDSLIVNLIITQTNLKKFIMIQEVFI